MTGVERGEKEADAIGGAELLLGVAGAILGAAEFVLGEAALGVVIAGATKTGTCAARSTVKKDSSSRVRPNHVPNPSSGTRRRTSSRRRSIFVPLGVVDDRIRR